MVGYIGVTYAPCTQLIPKLLEIYPNAKVICTTRDPESWAKSLAQFWTLALMLFLRPVLLPLPGMRHFPAYIDQVSIQWEKLYHDRPQDHDVATSNRHISWLKNNVPEDRLFFVDVKDGWGPLCKALGKEPPKDVPFPRFNDSEAIQETSKYHIQRGPIRWAGIIVILSVPGLAYYLTNRLRLWVNHKWVKKRLDWTPSLAITGTDNAVQRNHWLIVGISYYLLNLVQETPSMLCCSDTRFRKRPRDQNQP